MNLIFPIEIDEDETLGLVHEETHVGWRKNTEKKYTQKQNRKLIFIEINITKAESVAYG